MRQHLVEGIVPVKNESVEGQLVVQCFLRVLRTKCEFCASRTDWAGPGERRGQTADPVLTRLIFTHQPATVISVNVMADIQNELVTDLNEVLDGTAPAWDMTAPQQAWLHHRPRSLEHRVINVFSAALWTCKGESLAVTVTLLISQLGGRPKHAPHLILPLVLLLCPELGGVQTEPGSDEHSVDALDGIADSGHHRMNLLGQVVLCVQRQPPLLLQLLRGIGPLAGAQVRAILTNDVGDCVLYYILATCLE